KTNKLKRKEPPSSTQEELREAYLFSGTSIYEDASEISPARILGSSLAASETSWAAAVQGDQYLVNKSYHLKLILGCGRSTDYVHRYPMSGKTMFLGMIKNFFGLVEEENALEAKRTLFNELLLGHVDGGLEFIDNHCGQYPII
ncbi:hypothetical protein H4219_006178, partial [Mycoemilia scoparia]